MARVEVMLLEFLPPFFSPAGTSRVGLGGLDVRTCSGNDDGVNSEQEEVEEDGWEWGIGISRGLGPSPHEGGCRWVVGRVVWGIDALMRD
jgi:hypothetical protein